VAALAAAAPGHPGTSHRQEPVRSVVARLRVNGAAGLRTPQTAGACRESWYRTVEARFANVRRLSAGEALHSRVA